MKLRVIVDGRPVELEINHNGATCHFRVLSPRSEPGPARTASLEQVEPGIQLVLLDGRSYEVRLEPGPGRLIASVRGRRFAVEVEDPRRPRRKGGGVFGEGRQNVTAPMPGRVVRVLVAEGDRVEAGQSLVVVEAMKMQNEMKSAKAGRVVKISASEGAAVSAGEVLAIIE